MSGPCITSCVDMTLPSLQHMIQAHILDVADPEYKHSMLRLGSGCPGAYEVAADKTSLQTVVAQDPSTMDDEGRNFQREVLAIHLAKGRGCRYYQVCSACICPLQ